MPPGSVTASFLLAWLEGREGNTQGLKRSGGFEKGWKQNPESTLRSSQRVAGVTFASYFGTRGGWPVGSAVQFAAPGGGEMPAFNLWNLTPRINHCVISFFFLLFLNSSSGSSHFINHGRRDGTKVGRGVASEERGLCHSCLRDTVFQKRPNEKGGIGAIITNAWRTTEP